MPKFLLSFIFTLTLFGYGSAVSATQEQTPAKENGAIPTAPSFENFAGKITKNRVRLRCRPALDGHIVQEFAKNDLVLVTGQEGDFWIVTPPANMKFFVCRSYVIDNTVEANRINIRLKPDTESPIIGQLMHGDHVEGEVSATDDKWLEISPPNTAHFFVAKEFVENVGDQEYFSKTQSRKQEVELLLQSAYFAAQEECKKPYNEMSLDDATGKFEAICQNYTDFPEHIRQAKEGLALLQDSYVQKKLSFLEAKLDLPKNANCAETHAKKEESVKKQPVAKASFPPEKTPLLTKKMSAWLSMEEELFSAWHQLNADKDMAQFYLEQEINGKTLSGVVESYDTTLVKDPPGDFLLKVDAAPTAFLYSTRVDLTPYIGKKVTIKAAQRANHNFAYPAFFVTSVN